MKGLNRGIRLSIAVLALFLAVPAGAQESLGYGKTPAQMFASDCAICHKTVNGLSRSAGLFGLDSFLRQHYTASRESAAAISAYIQAMDKGAPPPVQRTKRTAKGSDKKPATAKPGEPKPAEAKASDTKPSEPKAGEVKPAEPKPAEAKAAEPKPAESKPAEAKAEAKPEAKPETKPETVPSEPKAAQSAKPDKSD